MVSLLLTLFLATAPGPCSAADTTVVCKCKQGSATACEALKQTDPKAAAELEKAAASATGQQHHVISRPIAEKLKDHATLGGRYTARDPRFVTRAADKAAHNGYQQWHRDVDREVIAWLNRYDKATPQQFEAFLRSIYTRPEMLARFPHGL